MEYVIVAVAAVILVFIVQIGLDARVAQRALGVLVLAFVARLLIHVFLLRSNAIAYGGDNITYESRALEVVEYWKNEGFTFVTSEEITELYSVAVPCNVFAVIIYLCAGPAPLACTAIVALIACGLCIVMYRFARLIGADERASFRVLVLMAFLPTFMLHTSDMFKDGFNAFLIISCLGLAASNVRRFDIRKLLLLGPLLWALWNVRPYMVFMCAIPLVLGLANLKRALPLCALAILATLLVPVASSPDMADNSPIAAMQEQLERGQSESFRRANAEGGSGVVFEDGGNPWNAFLPKLVYTLLSPFPWMDGSLVLQLAKIETLLWYYLLWSAACAITRMRGYDRRMLLILLLFIVPCTIAYTTTMSNVGLIVRQRMPIVMTVSLLSAIAWTRVSRDGQQFVSGAGTDSATAGVAVPSPSSGTAGKPPAETPRIR
ncbi:hypothetical protein [Streptosporangium lutulentum]|uniref:Glycosyltransferase RgtA/B/C/D-like domain-containing protein n=1 Tax=Streptosporangium lutulentum TaxID=1461250 RepID=A0ABT9Q3X3_9ACTN|nr:hypothetical protein [Streptosporangium lutulentum]MDP9841387.1 hypothetical protein [Streptosporangium lutulentum]